MTKTRSRIIALGLLLIVAVAACGNTTGDAQQACDINAELEQFYGGDFPPREARGDLGGASRIVMALKAPLAHYELADVSRFAAAFDRLREVAPDEIGPAVETLSESFAPMFEWATDSGEQPEAAAFERLDSAETNAAGFALEDWANANCSE